jgi:hypothetical protein
MLNTPTASNSKDGARKRRARDGPEIRKRAKQKKGAKLSLYMISISILIAIDVRSASVQVRAGPGDENPMRRKE